MGRGKYTSQEALEAVPEPTTKCPVVQVLGPRGQHLHEVVVLRDLVDEPINARLNTENNSWFTTLVQLPPKFRSVVWVKRGSYILADLSEHFTDKVGGEVVMVLMADQVKHLKQTNQWPSEYANIWDSVTGSASKNADIPQHNESDESDDDLLIGSGNPNRGYIDESSDEDDEDENNE